MSFLNDHMAARITEDDGSFRTKMLGIAANMTNVIAMGRGDPDFHTPEHIVAAGKKALDENQHHYTGPHGIPPLRAAIAEHLNKEYGLDYAADDIAVTAGVQESITLIMLALIQPGDDVLSQFHPLQGRPEDELTRMEHERVVTHLDQLGEILLR